MGDMLLPVLPNYYANQALYHHELIKLGLVPMPGALIPGIEYQCAIGMGAILSYQPPLSPNLPSPFHH